LNLFVGAQSVAVILESDRAFDVEGFSQHEVVMHLTDDVRDGVFRCSSFEVMQV